MFYVWYTGTERPVCQRRGTGHSPLLERAGQPCHYSVLHCTALHCTALYPAVYPELHWTALHCTSLHFTALQNTELHCIIPRCTALHQNNESWEQCNGESKPILQKSTGNFTHYSTQYSVICIQFLVFSIQYSVLGIVIINIIEVGSNSQKGKHISGSHSSIPSPIQEKCFCLG